MARDAFDVARSAAERAYPVVTKYRHSSVIFDRKGRVIAIGRNHFQGKIVAAEDDGRPIRRTVHSEIHALGKVDIRRLEDATIVNFGRTRAHTILARPCENCWAVLKKLGFKKTFYTLRSPLDAPSWREERF